MPGPANRTSDMWIDFNLGDNHGAGFIIEPYTRFKGEAGKQATMFFASRNGNAIKFKSFWDIGQIFAK